MRVVRLVIRGWSPIRGVVGPRCKGEMGEMEVV